MKNTTLRIVPILIWAAAILLSFDNLKAIGHALAATPPPANRLTVRYHDGQAEVNDLVCSYGTANFYDGERLWRFPCSLASTDAPVIVAMDFAQGSAQVWPLPPEYEHLRIESRSENLMNAAFVPDGEQTGQIFIYTQTNSFESRRTWEQETFYLLLNRTGGSVQAIPAPPTDVQPEVRGVSWVDGQPEVVIQMQAGDGLIVQRFRYAGAEWSGAAVAAPDGCTSCLLQLAYHENGAWRYLWLDVPRASVEMKSDWGDRQITPTVLPVTSAVLSDETGARQPLTLSGVEQEDLLLAFDGVFDTSPGHIFYYADMITPVSAHAPREDASDGDMHTVPARHFRYRNGVWKTIEIPAAELTSPDVEFLAHQTSGVQAVYDDHLPWLFTMLAYSTRASSSASASTSTEQRDLNYSQLTLIGEQDWLAARLLPGNVPGGELDSLARLALGVETVSEYINAWDGLLLRTSQTSSTFAYAKLFFSPIDFVYRYILAVPDRSNGYVFTNSTFQGRPRYLRLDTALNRMDAPNALQRLLMIGGNWLVWPETRAVLLAFIGMPVLLLLAVVLRERLSLWGWAYVPVIFIALAVLSRQDLAAFITWV